MTSLAYTPDENILRIKMDKNTKYVVLEGVDDIPKYENALKHVDFNFDFQPIALGCKNNVLKLLDKTTNNNFVAIVDFDFGDHSLRSDSRLLSLTRYSIENYVISNPVLNSLIGSLTSSSSKDIPSWFSIDEWITHVHSKLSSLIKTLHYYQTKVLTDRISWGASDLTVNGHWQFCDEKINRLVNRLFQQNVPHEELINHPDYSNINEQELTKRFPGKLLIKSLYFFLKAKFTEKFHRPTKLTGACTNYLVFSNFASTFISYEVELREILQSVIDKLQPMTSS